MIAVATCRACGGVRGACVSNLKPANRPWEWRGLTVRTITVEEAKVIEWCLRTKGCEDAAEKKGDEQ